MKIVTVEQMRQLERRADAAGVGYAQMMEAAGRSVAEAIAPRWNPLEQQVLLLIGPGNNGGDGLVAARHLRAMGASAWVYTWNQKSLSAVATAEIPTAQAQAEFERTVQGARAEDDADLSRLQSALDWCTLVVDALFGTGANRPIEGALKRILERVKAARRRVIAVDLPSGLNADTGALDPASVAADLTVTFACPKAGFYKFPAADALGELVIADIGIPPAFTDDIPFTLATRADVARRLPTRPRSGHKGTFGKTMIVSGSSRYTGAPYLSAAATARVGAGLVTLATTSEVQHVVAAALHVATFLPLPDADGAIASDAAPLLVEQVRDYDSMLLGPGLGRAAGTQQFVYRLLDAQSRLPSRIIVDADGLNALSERPEWWRSLPPTCVLTPHAGEFARLTRLSIAEVEDARETAARTHAQQWNQVVLLKGAFTLVAEPGGQVTLLPFANPALATAGSGDVLSGIIAGLLAQGLSPRDAAIAGGYVHALAGDIAGEEIGDAGVIASDLLERIPEALRLIKK